MPIIGVYEPAKRLPGRVREGLTLDARRRFILLFVLFDAMFCLLLLVSLQNTQLAEDNRQLGNALAAVEASAAEAKKQIAELEAEIKQLQTPGSTSEVAGPEATPMPTSQTSVPTVTPTDTLTPPNRRSKPMLGCKFGTARKTQQHSQQLQIPNSRS